MSLNEGSFCIPRDVWQYLETFLVVITRGATGILWVEAKDATEHPTIKDYPPQMSAVWRLRSSQSVLSWVVGIIGSVFGQPPLGRSGGRKPEQGATHGAGVTFLKEKDEAGHSRELHSGWD